LHGVSLPQGCTGYGEGGNKNHFKDENCNMCGLCVDTCPWGAIDKNDCKTINNATCLRCFRCIKICPACAKKVTDEKFLAWVPQFEARLNAKRKEPELFLPA
jgi:uncharacterized Fe-S center protein